MPTLGEFWRELFSTYNEWHYFIVGVSMGTVVGWVLKTLVDRVLPPKTR